MRNSSVTKKNIHQENKKKTKHLVQVCKGLKSTTGLSHLTPSFHYCTYAHTERGKTAIQAFPSGASPSLN